MRARTGRPSRPRGDVLRPTAARVRGGLFNSLGPTVRGASVLDLFAGTGALGLDALRRGAARVVFVEHDATRARAIARQLDGEGFAPRGVVRCLDAYAAARRLTADGDAFDLILLDPPYGEGRLTRALAAAAGLLTAGGQVVAEGHWRDRPELPPGLVVAREARYGETVLWFIRPAAVQDP